MTDEGQEQDVPDGYAFISGPSDEASRADWINHLVASVAHDMRAPLATIATSAELLEQETDANASNHFITIIQRQTLRLQDMVRDLSDYFSLTPGLVSLQEEVFDLRDLVRETCESVEAVHEAHRLRAELPSFEVRLRADYGKIQRVLENLIRNALRYAPSDTIVNVRVRVSQRISDSVVIDVEDEGQGIPILMRERIFEPFVRLDNRRSGQGLGLYIVKLLTEAHHGHVWVKSGPKGGACFHVVLPARSEAEQPVNVRALS